MSEKKKSSVVAYFLSTIILALAVGLVVWAVISTNSNIDYRKVLNDSVTQTENLLKNFRAPVVTSQPELTPGTINELDLASGVDPIFTLNMNTVTMFQYVANAADFEMNTVYKKVAMSSGHTGTLAIKTADSKIDAVMELKDDSAQYFYTMQINYDSAKGVPTQLTASYWGNINGNANQVDQSVLEINFSAKTLHAYMVSYQDTIKNLLKSNFDNAYLVNTVITFGFLEGTINGNVLSVSNGKMAAGCTQELWSNNDAFKAESEKLFPILKQHKAVTFDALQLNSAAVISEFPQQFMNGWDNHVWKLNPDANNTDYLILEKGNVNVEGA